MAFPKVSAAGFVTQLSFVVATSVKTALSDDPFSKSLNGSEQFEALPSVAQSLIHFQVGCVRYSF